MRRHPLKVFFCIFSNPLSGNFLSIYLCQLYSNPVEFHVSAICGRDYGENKRPLLLSQCPQRSFTKKPSFLPKLLFSPRSKAYIESSYLGIRTCSTKNNFLNRNFKRNLIYTRAQFYDSLTGDYLQVEVKRMFIGFLSSILRQFRIHLSDRLQL